MTDQATARVCDECGIDLAKLEQQIEQVRELKAENEALANAKPDLGAAHEQMAGEVEALKATIRSAYNALTDIKDPEVALATAWEMLGGALDSPAFDEVRDGD